MTGPLFSSSADSKTLAHVLRGCKVGDVATYASLSAAIGKDVREEASAALRTARRIVLREDRMVFDAVRDQGLQRLADTEIVALADRARDHIRRTSRRTAKALVCVDYDAMPRDQQVKHNTALSMLGAIGEMASDRSVKRLESAVAAAGESLPAAKASIAAIGSVK